MINLGREISERNFGNEIQGKENMGLQNWGDIEDGEGREKGDNLMRESNNGETCMKG